MKKILYIGLAIAAAATMSISCSEDLLEIQQKGVVSYEDFYDGSVESAQSASISVYAAAMKFVNVADLDFGHWNIAPAYFVLTNAPADDYYYGSGNSGDHVFGLEINEYRDSFGSNSTVIVADYKAAYQLIYNCNLLIDNFETGKDATIDKCIAEARFFRAWAYLHLATFWGNPPLVEHLMTGAERPENTENAVVLDFVISELLDAANKLPSKSGLNDPNMAIKVTKEAALAMAGKAQVQAKKYADAKTTLKKVIDSGKYALIDGAKMSELFHRECDACEEWLLDLNFMDFQGGISAFGGKYHFQRGQSCYWRDLKSMPSHLLQPIGWGGGGNPSKSFVEAIMANEPDSYRRKAWVISYEELLGDFKYPDEGDETWTREQRLADPGRGLSSASYFGNIGWFQYKYAPRQADLQADNSCNDDINTPVMRYAEVLLLYAEACAQTSDDGSGLKALNDIQKRAGAPVTALTLDNVKKEKRFEMFMEGVRFPDLVRWGDAATVLKDQGKEVPSFIDNFATTGVHKAEVDLSNAYYNKVYGFKAGKNEVMPYPLGELDINENIKQNPGWN